MPLLARLKKTQRPSANLDSPYAGVLLWSTLTPSQHTGSHTAGKPDLTLTTIESSCDQVWMHQSDQQCT